MSYAVIDTDILLKGACYNLLAEFVSAIPPPQAKVGVLGAARFVIHSKLTRSKPIGQAKKIISTIEIFINTVEVLEPTDQEVKVAADIEFLAQERGLNLDVGESQLTAMVVIRDLEWMITGDKRAICALENLLNDLPIMSKLGRRIVCLEQLVRRSLEVASPAHIRAAICSEPDVDRALTICFCCTNPASTLDSWIAGLSSYIEDLRKSAPTVLAA
jgi:hypothetical protein